MNSQFKSGWKEHTALTERKTIHFARYYIKQPFWKIQNATDFTFSDVNVQAASFKKCRFTR